MCRDECDARVNIPKLMLEAKAAHQAEHGLDRADWVLARAEGFAVARQQLRPDRQRPARRADRSAG